MLSGVLIGDLPQLAGRLELFDGCAAVIARGEILLVALPIYY